jgi:hypothetical protein
MEDHQVCRQAKEEEEALEKPQSDISFSYPTAEYQPRY